MGQSGEGHIVKRFDADLMKLHGRVLEMGGLVSDQLSRALKTLDDQDVEAARGVIERDRDVNVLELRTDECIAEILARRQPVARDLRLVLAVSKAVTDLERIGDEAIKIARMTIEIYGREASILPGNELLDDLELMGREAQHVLRAALEAFDTMDVERAMSTLGMQDRVEKTYRAALRRLVTYVMDDSRNVGHMIQIALVAKALERIADHARNISQYVVYCVQGTDIRHASAQMARSGG